MVSVNVISYFTVKRAKFIELSDSNEINPNQHLVNFQKDRFIEPQYKMLYWDFQLLNSVVVSKSVDDSQVKWIYYIYEANQSS